VIRAKLPASDYSLLIRTDFSNDQAWRDLCAAIQAPQTADEFQAMVECIDDKSCEGLLPAMVLSVLPNPPGRSFVFLADSRAIEEADHPVLVVDLLTDPGHTFRVVASRAWGVENNLRLANMDFSEFADCIDADGVFRCFPGEPK
jgi:hypothetical protein